MCLFLCCFFVPFQTVKSRNPNANVACQPRRPEMTKFSVVKMHYHINTHGKYLWKLKQKSMSFKMVEFWCQIDIFWLVLMYFMQSLSIKNGMFWKSIRMIYLIYINTILYSHEKYEGKVWAGLHSLKEIKTTAGRIKQRKFTKDDVSFYESKNHMTHYIHTYSSFWNVSMH